MEFNNIGALDIRVQCSGFIYALSIADQYIKSKMFNLKTILRLRSLGYYSWEKYKEYADELSLHSNVNNLKKKNHIHLTTKKNSF